MGARNIPPPVDPERALKKICAFIRKELKKTGRERLVVGVSGGVDSAVAAALAVAALGRDSLLGVKMPHRTSSPGSEKDADALIRRIGIRSAKVDITGIVDSYFRQEKNASRVRIGNFMARARMAVLFDLSAKEDAVVLGTGNRTEALLGYTTLYGDSACGFNPLGGLFKSHVYQLARHLEVPGSIIDKAPSADLWPGQTDEGEMGLLYSEADAVLYLMIDEGMTAGETAAKLRMPLKKVAGIIERVEKNNFKRVLPPVASI